MAELKRGISGLNMGLWLVFLYLHSPGSHAGSPCWYFIPYNESYIISCPENEVLAPRLTNSGPVNTEFIGQRTLELNKNFFQKIKPGHLHQLINNFTKDMLCIQSWQVDKFCPNHVGLNFYTGGRGCGYVAGCNSNDPGLPCPRGGCNITIEAGPNRTIYLQVYIQYSPHEPYFQTNIEYVYIKNIINSKEFIIIPQGLRKPRFIIGYEIFHSYDIRINDWIHADCWQRKGLVDGSEQPAHECVSGPDLESSTPQALTISHNMVDTHTTEPLIYITTFGIEDMASSHSDAPVDFPTMIAIICGVIFVVAFIISIVVVIKFRRKCRKVNPGKRTTNKKEVGQDEDQPGKYENLQNFSAENTKAHIYSQINILNEDSTKVNHEGEDNHEYEEITDLGNTNDSHIYGASNGQRAHPSCSKSAFQGGHQYENVKPFQKGAVKKVQMYENIQG